MIFTLVLILRERFKRQKTISQRDCAEYSALREARALPCQINYSNRMSFNIQKLDNQHYETTTIRFLQFDSCKFCTHIHTRISLVN